MAGRKKAPHNAAPETLTKAEGFFLINLREVVSNSSQTRTIDDAIPNLKKLGYGLFEQQKGHKDKPTIWSLLTSEKPEDWTVGVGLITEHEPEIAQFAGRLMVEGQLQNVQVSWVGDKKLNVVFGMRRCLGTAFNYAKTAGTFPLHVKAEIAEESATQADLLARALSENVSRKSQSPMEIAETCIMLKRHMSVDAIATKLDINSQTVRNYLKLGKLTPEEKERVHNRRLGVVNACKLVDARDKGEAKPGETAADIPENRHRMPTYKQATSLYNAVEKPKDVEDEEWALWTDPQVRKFLARYLKVEFSTHEQMVEAKKQLEQKKLQTATENNGQKSGE